ncbi:uncharacterized protein LAESUDRAFT_170871 [Laetiporus sulphureus 93-53]|uniref:Uncharacterized protein n=1 Tax=Laetiporus sulphureus 93-53 TaxID=1314785 RepID=A0A165HUI7_9APHY|nr:uncharacterized protein LAESUDRAFT_170871 [Laetiporus sulphureus 93-53]KZT12205.1 hypothetical protein LAESUDRAFT_170871 [Laetiporus sulphureus 93-53]
MDLPHCACFTNIHVSYLLQTSNLLIEEVRARISSPIHDLPVWRCQAQVEPFRHERGTASPNGTVSMANARPASHHLRSDDPLPHFAFRILIRLLLADTDTDRYPDDGCWLTSCHRQVRFHPTRRHRLFHRLSLDVAWCAHFSIVSEQWLWRSCSLAVCDFSLLAFILPLLVCVRPEHARFLSRILYLASNTIPCCRHPMLSSRGRCLPTRLMDRWQIHAADLNFNVYP